MPEPEVDLRRRSPQVDDLRGAVAPPGAGGEERAAGAERVAHLARREREQAGDRPVADERERAGAGPARRRRARAVVLGRRAGLRARVRQHVAGRGSRRRRLVLERPDVPPRRPVGAAVDDADVSERVLVRLAVAQRARPAGVDQRRVGAQPHVARALEARVDVDVRVAGRAREVGVRRGERHPGAGREAAGEAPHDRVRDRQRQRAAGHPALPAHAGGAAPGHRHVLELQPGARGLAARLDRRSATRAGHRDTRELRRPPAHPHRPRHHRGAHAGAGVDLERDRALEPQLVCRAVRILEPQRRSAPAGPQPRRVSPEPDHPDRPARRVGERPVRGHAPEQDRVAHRVRPGRREGVRHRRARFAARDPDVDAERRGVGPRREGGAQHQDQQR